MLSFFQIFYYSFCAFSAQKYLIDTTAVNYHAMTPDYVKHPGAMSEMACKYIKEKKPAFAAFIYDNPDYPGHMHGFHTPEYYENLKVHDAYVGEIIAEIFALDTPQVWTSKSMSQVFE